MSKYRFMNPYRLFLFFFLISRFLYSQETEMTVTYISTQNGLADNEVNSIIKDKTGFMWFGTNDGLSRYDGYNLKNYTPKNNFLYVLKLLQTDDGLIWCASTNGLYCFDPVNERFIRVKDSEGESTELILKNRVTGLVKGADNALWLSTNKGLYHISNISREQLQTGPIKIKIYQKENTSIPTNLLTSLHMDTTEDILWIGSSDAFLISFDLKTNKFTKISLVVNSNEKGAITNINTIFEKENALWIGTMGGGIVKLNKTSLALEVIQRKASGNSISHDDIYSIQSDNSGNLWAGTWNGIDRIALSNTSLNKAKIDNFNWDHPFFNERLENRISTLYWEKSGVMWIGTFGGGVVKISIRNSNFKRYNFDSRFEVNSFLEDKEGYLWISMYHGAIKNSLQKTGKAVDFTFNSFNKEKLQSGLGSNIILCSAMDANGTLWFGSNQSSLYRKEAKSKRFYELKITPKNEPNWEGFVKALCIDLLGNFWIGTDNGLVYYDVKKETFQVIRASSKQKKTINNDHVRSVFQDSKGQLWVGTDYGLNKLVAHENGEFTFDSFNDAYISNEIFYNQEVWCIFEDSEFRLWIGYRGGLGEFDTLNGRIIIYNTHSGLPNNFVTCITEDTKGNLWIGTNSGISKFNKTSKEVKTYYIANNNRAAYKDSFGNLYFGNNKGFLSFHPKDIKKNSWIPPVIISDLKIDNTSIYLGDTINDQIIFNKALPFVKEIRLNHLNHNFALEFVALSYPFQAFNKYAYKLVGKQQEWTVVNARSRTVNFNDLEPGQYTFMVKGSNCDGVWSTIPTELKITILPVWWDTVWARIIFGFLFVASLFLVYYFRERRNQKKQWRTAAKLKLEHHLKIAKIEKRKEEELSEMKSKFFTNLSHEIRTPLTLIIAPLQDILNQKTVPLKIKVPLKVMDVNANRLLKLINQLLDFRKIERGKMALHINEGDIHVFTKAIFNTFKPFAKSKSIRYTYAGTKKPFLMWFDHRNLEIVIINLLSNAFKFTPIEGTVTVKVQRVEIEGVSFCRISIIDTGKGIALKHQKHLFDRFYQVPVNQQDYQNGTGIGLSIVKEVITLHKGTVTVTSTLGEGAKFELLIPVNKKEYPAKYMDVLPEKSVLINEQTRKEEPVEAIEEVVEEPMLCAPSQSNGTILIVDDTEEILNYLKGVFKSKYHVLEASNGKIGLKLAKKHLPDLIISDVMMPVMSGVELCKILKESEKTSHIPIILLTAKASEHQKIEGLQLGADDYIIKPFDSVLLCAKVDSFIANRKKAKDFFKQKITLGPKAVTLDSQEVKFLKTAIDLIERDIMNPEFNVQVLAENLHMSQATLYRKTKAFTDLSITQFIRSIRLKRAAQIIVLNDYTISEVSNMVGFSDQGYFRKCFLKQFGVNPSVYAKRETQRSAEVD